MVRKPGGVSFFSGAVVLIAALTATFFVQESKLSRTGVRSSIREDLRTAASNRAFVGLMSLVMMATFSVMVLEPLITVYVLQLGASKQDASLQSGIIFSAVGIAAILAAPRWGKLGAKLGYPKILFIGLLGGGIGNLLQFFAVHLVGFGLLRFLYGIFFRRGVPCG